MKTPKEPPHVPDSELKMPEEAGFAGEATKASFNIVPVLIGIVVVLVAILVGLLLWGMMANQAPEPVVEATRPTIEENNEPESTTAEAQVETIQAVSTSDEVAAIEADIESTDLDELDAELTAIEAELDAALSEEF